MLRYYRHDGSAEMARHHDGPNIMKQDSAISLRKEEYKALFHDVIFCFDFARRHAVLASGARHAWLDFSA